MTDNTDSPASNQTHVPIEEYVHLQKKYLESVLTEQSFMIEIKELLDKSIGANARISELEKQNGRLRDLAYIAYQNGYKDAPPYSKYERSLDELELMWKRSFAYAALKGEK
jgi:hypothetical protein